MKMVSTKEGCAVMRKKYIVRLTDEEPKTLELIVRKFKGTSQKVRRAHCCMDLCTAKSGCWMSTWADINVFRRSKTHLKVLMENQ